VTIALAVDPAWSVLAGHRFPGFPTFGLPCPTALFTTGMQAFGRPLAIGRISSADTMASWRHDPHAPPSSVNIRPTPWTAAFAGAVTAIAWPLLSARFAGQSDGLGLDRIIVALLVIALPAHLFVVGLKRSADAPANKVDIAMAQRILAWICAALGITLLRLAAGP